MAVLFEENRMTNKVNLHFQVFW